MRTFFFTASLLISLSPLCIAGQIYTWVDPQGVTHFDGQPPQGQEAATIVTPASATTAPKKLPASAPIGDQKAIERTVKKQVAEQEAKLRTYCETARTSLAQLQNNPRLRENTEGGMKRLSNEQRQERIAEVQQSIAQNCQ